MKKIAILLASLFSLSLAPAVQALDVNETVMLQNEIRDLKAELASKQAELHALLEHNEGIYTIETNTATYSFSNPRIEDDRILLNLDFTNDTKGILDVNNEIWMLTFSQEDDTSITQLWMNNEGLKPNQDRRPLNMNMRVKSGATVPLIIALSPTMSNMVYYDSTELLVEDTPEEAPEEADSEEVQDTTDALDIPNPLFMGMHDFSIITDAPLHIRVDPFSSPSGQSVEIQIPLEVY